MKRFSYSLISVTELRKERGGNACPVLLFRGVINAISVAF